MSKKEIGNTWLRSIRALLNLQSALFLLAIFVPQVTLAVQFTNTTHNSWRYSEMIVSSPNITAYYPAATNDYASAIFKGYAIFEDSGDGPLIVDYAGNPGYQVLSTWILSTSNQSINLAFNGDDGHSLFVDGEFLDGGGFGVAVSGTFSLSAYVPRKLELAIYNSLGGWGGFIGLGPWSGYSSANWSNLLENTQGLSLEADGFWLTNAPAIITDIQDQTVGSGSDVVFKVAASGANPLAFQWTVNGVDLMDNEYVTGVQSNQLTIREAGLSQAGDYRVIITNTFGAITSSLATLSVSDSMPPLLLANPNSQTIPFGSNLLLTVVAGGTHPLSYQWLFNGSAFSDDSRINGSTSNILSIQNLSYGDAGAYQVLVSNSFGVTTSSLATVTVPIINCANAPENLIGWWQGENNSNDSASTNHGIMVGGLDYADGRVGRGFHFTARDDSQYVQIPSSPELEITGPLTIEAWFKLDEMPEFRLEIASKVYNVGYFLRLEDDNRLNFEVFGQNQGAGVRSTTVFSTGVWYHVAGTFDGTNLSAYVNGALQQTIYAPINLESDSTPLTIGGGPGGFSLGAPCVIDEVSIYNRALSPEEIYGIFTAGMAGKCGGIAISSDPHDQTIPQGDPVSISATISGRLPVSYQWLFNGANLVNDARINGSTSNVLSISDAMLSDAGAYQLVASNAFGVVTSAVATITVSEGIPPFILSNLHDHTNFAGDNISWMVNAGGSGRLRYQWYFANTLMEDDGRISGSQTESISILGSQTTDSGQYYVVVSNAFGSVTSTISTITIEELPVNHPPVWSQFIPNQVAVAGSPFVFMVPADTFIDPDAGQSLSYLATELEAGLTLDSATGSFSGTPVTPGAYVVSVMATDNGTPPMGVTGSFVLVVTSSTAPMDLAGDSLQAEWSYPDFNTLFYPPQAFSAGASNASFTYNNGQANYSITVTEDTIVVSQFQGDSQVLGASVGYSGPPGSPNGATDAGVTFNGLVLTDLSRVFVGATVDLVNDLPGWDSSRIVISDNRLGFNFAGLSPTAGQSAVVIHLQPGAPLSATNAPMIIQQPTNKTLLPAANANFSVAANGTPPLSYQWRFHGTNLVDGNRISGSSSNVLSILEVQSGDAGGYQVLVANTNGSVTSDVAILSLFDITQPAILCPADISTMVGPGLDTVSVTFVVSATDDSGEASVVCSPPSGSLFSLGTTTVHCTATDPSGNVSTCSFTVTVLPANTPPVLPPITNYAVAEGMLLMVTNAAIDNDTPAQQLTFTLGEGAPSGATIDPSTGLFQWQPSRSQAPSTNLITVVVTDNGMPTRNTSQSFYVFATLVPAVITTQPASLTLNAGESASFSVAAAGSTTLSYSWSKDGSPLIDGSGISGSASNRLTVNDVNGASAGIYRVNVSNPAGSVLSGGASLTLSAPAFASPGLNPLSVTADSPSFSLELQGAGFLPGATAYWNGASRPTTFASANRLLAFIPATDLQLPSGQGIGTALVTIQNPDGKVSPALAFTIVSPNIGTVQSQPAPPGGTATAAAPPSGPTQAGVTASVSNNSSTQPVTVSAATYASNPGPGTSFDAGSSYVDVKVSGVGSGDSMQSYFYYPSTVTGAAEAALALLYYTGTAWVPVLSSGGAAPTKNQTDNLDSTVSGGRFTVIFDGTSTPPITQLTGTPFSLAIDTTPPAITCAANIRATAGPGLSPVPVSFNVIATDNSGTATVVCTPPSGSLFPLGTTTVHCTATDSAGNLSTCSFTVSVNPQNLAPTISVPPMISLDAGQTLSFSVTASDANGQDSLSFQAGPGAPAGVVVDPVNGHTTWTIGSGLGGTTNAISLIVTDNGYPPLSATGTVTVIVRRPNTSPILAPIADYQVDDGSLLTVTNTAIDTDMPAQQLTYSFGPNAPTGATIDPMSGQIHWLPTSAQAGTNPVSVVVTDNGTPALSATQSFSVIVALVAPTIVTQPTGLGLNVGQIASFQVFATGSTPLSYRWSKDGAPLVDGAGIAGSASSLLIISNPNGGNSGNYSVLISNVVGSALSSNAALVLNGHPVITNQPASTNVAAGIAATFIVGATGTAPLRYQWQLLGTNLPGATTNTYTVLKAGTTNAGPYTVMVSNQAGIAIGGPATLGINSKPVIVTQPVNTAAPLGSNVTFTVGVTGTDPLKYQWKLNATNLAGATQSSLSFVLSSAAQAGPYTVTITNGLGTVTSAKATLTIATPPVITKALLAHTNLVGTANTFSTTANGTAPLVYRWQLNGTTIPGASTTVLALSNIVVATGGTYSVSVSNAAGVASSSALLTVALDITAPTVTITSPTAAQNLVSNLLTAVGTATDTAQVTNVTYSLNGSVWQKPVTTNAWKNWSVVLDSQLIPGTNTLAVQAQDFSGNVSLPLTRSFFFSVPSVLTVRTNGLGTLSTNLDHQTLLVGQTYSITALPAQGQVFTNWQVGAVLSANPVLTFTMQSNLVLTANFVPSPYGARVVGTYNGLFFETNVVAFPSAGLLSLTVDTNGGFAGKAYIAGAALTIAGGLFDTSGHGQLVVSRATQHQTNLLLDLHLDLSGASQTITGLVSSVDGAWSAPYWGGRAIYGPTNTTPLAGNYIFAIPGSGNTALGPVGNGYGAVTLATNGVPTLLGNLGDATKQAQALITVSITPQGFWPLYQPLYSGGGALIGWLAFSNTPGVLTNLTGTVMWIKTANATNVLYPGGFTNQADVIGSGFVTPTTGNRILGLPVSQVVIAGANLPTQLTNSISLSTANVVTVSPNPYSLKLTFTTASGLFTGSFINPLTGLTNLLNGAVLQNQNFGVGEFNATNSVGAILLR